MRSGVARVSRTATPDRAPVRTDVLVSRPVNSRERGLPASSVLPSALVHAPQVNTLQPDAPIPGAPGSVTPDADIVSTGTVVYSAADPQVVPPTLVSPRLPKAPPPGVRLEELPEVEFVISTTGDVESVKIVSAGTGAQPGMKLSAVKNWRFEPATRGGQAVRYRHRVRLMNR